MIILDKNVFDNLMKKIKVFEKKFSTLPIAGEQAKHKLIHVIDHEEKFTLIINRKGHRNRNNLTLIINSSTYKSSMVRFDVNGSDHENPPDFKVIPTPHLHIFTDEYDNGRIAVPLNEITDIILVNEIIDSLEFFMDYTNIKRDSLVLNDTLL
ncbi:DUF6978 family protein [Staphylococcus saprophyticus]|uniref:DUF6978 family protein n=1 Tax=Staphylococcus saprophyticus TaxID=29385 RepID=UPI001F5122A6|nr:hypothetical protein [Staphylococcus saprophyticus]MDW4232606.1 hypothetical protein [Staphylococcus saprophyticus]MDW4249827.1 hypothetical protein [Staphylococcus saprophyticus]MDW4376739.1 hypothetical protein [Staphylococcus saprophyticus]MEB7309612.1 hypothetical protein [Staphylococcus saprophyticus]